MLYVLKNSKSDFYPKHQFPEEAVNEFIKCPHCKIGPGSSWDIQSFGVQAGSRWPDFLPIGNFIVVSDVVVEVLKKNDIKGYVIGSKVSIRMYGNKYTSEPINYHCLLVTYGNVACANNSSGSYYTDSGYTRKRACDLHGVCRYCSFVDDGGPSMLEIDKLEIDYSTWNDSDISVCCSYVLVSRKLAKLFVLNKFTNVGVYKIADAWDWNARPLGIRDLA